MLAAALSAGTFPAILLTGYAIAPDEMIEAGRIDGAELFGISRHIVFPLSLPSFLVAFIRQFASIRSGFPFGLILSPNPAVRPVMVAPFNLAGRTACSGTSRWRGSCWRRCRR